ncbi:MAG: bifunctional [glutamine synthetase] adenylyltransferase/[glutamine synthetase]-adenylyl-L-tyrosine phosphorylase [Hyphomicrobium sp.]
MTASPPPASLATRISAAPHVAELAAATRNVAALAADAAANAPRLAAHLKNPKVGLLLAGVFEGSPYLAELARRDLVRLGRTLDAAPEALFADLTVQLADAMRAAESMPAAKSALRRYKSSVALLAALADLGGAWPVATVTHALSEAADAAVSQAVNFLFRAAVTRGQWIAETPNAPESASGYFVLAMGKHGAFELNYSSDIDLIVFFDRDKATLSGDCEAQTFFVRLTRDLVALLEERTPDGYVFRTDLRLRPDAGATQMALSTAAAHDYYENVGQNWERAAMIKARCCAGDFDAGGQFLAELAPFVWRKYLDYAAIADIHAMKRQIHAHKGFNGIAVLGHNIKLGRGGIREIEFFAQTQQLIAGGRQPDLRVRGTLEALAALEKRGWVKPNVRAELAAAYDFLRRLEHRLQMVADSQTHDMPPDAAGLDAIARFSGYATGEALANELRRTLETVERHYAGLFEDAPQLTRADANMVFAGASDDPKTLEELAKLGYSQPANVLAIVRGWHHGRSRAVRSPKARERLTEVQPALIEALADTVDPDGAIAEFDRFLSELPSGVQLFSLLRANPKLMRLVADMMGSAPRLSGILSKRRRLLDAVLDPRLIGDAIDPEAIDAVLASEFAAVRAASADDPTQDILDAARIVGHEQMFLVGARILTGAVSAAEAGASYATIAERLVSALLHEVTRQMEVEHGRVAGGEAVVVALGKLGSREMTAGSDLDLVLIYDCETDAPPSDGERPLAPSHYYTRLTQRLINAISAQTAQGSLYEVDMRLRPSGQKGPVATRLSSFIAYHGGEAWTWEHMALTRARVIAGPANLAARVDEAIRDVLVRPRAAEKIAADVRDMRQRIATEKGTDRIWDLKQVRGGLVDLEFIVQHLQLVRAADCPAILKPTTLSALQAMEAAGVLSPADASALASAGRLLHDLTQILRLCLDQPFDPAAAPAGLKALLARGAGAASFDEVENQLRQSLMAVHAAFDRLVSAA